MYVPKLNKNLVSIAILEVRGYDVISCPPRIDT